MKRPAMCPPTRRRGFTFVELMIASGLGVLVIGGTIAIYISVMRFWRAIDFRMETDRRLNQAMSEIAYGVDDRRGVRAAVTLAVATSGPNWTLTYTTGYLPPRTNTFTYSAAASNLMFNPGNRVVATNVSMARAIVQGNLLTVTVRLDRVEGRMHARREMGTSFSWRNQ